MASNIWLKQKRIHVPCRTCDQLFETQASSSYRHFLVTLSLSFLLSRSRPCSKTRWIPWEWIHRNSYLGLHSVLMTWNPFLPSRVLFKSCDSRRWSISYSTKVTSTLTYLVLGSISGSQRCFKLRIALLEYLIHEWFLRSQFLYFRLVEICGLT